MRTALRLRGNLPSLIFCTTSKENETVGRAAELAPSLSLPPSLPSPYPPPPNSVRTSFSHSGMALVCSTGVGGCCSIHSTARQTHRRRSPLSPSPLLLVSLLRSKDGGGRRGAAQVVGARRGLSSRTRRLEERGKKGGHTTKPSKEDLEGQGGGQGEGDAPFPVSSMEGTFVGSPSGQDAASPPMPDLPDLTPDFWEGPQWDGFGFFVQYLWAFGIVFALISGGIAVATYNEGASDFKQTSVYKESIQSRELLEESDSSGSEVFEANPTEAASNAE